MNEAKHRELSRNQVRETHHSNTVQNTNDSSEYAVDTCPTSYPLKPVTTLLHTSAAVGNILTPPPPPTPPAPSADRVLRPRGAGELHHHRLVAQDEAVGVGEGPLGRRGAGQTDERLALHPALLHQPDIESEGKAGGGGIKL